MFQYLRKILNGNTEAALRLASPILNKGMLLVVVVVRHLTFCLMFYFQHKRFF